MLSQRAAEHLLVEDALRSWEAANDRGDLGDAVLDGVLQHAARSENNRSHHRENHHNDDPLDHFRAVLVIQITGHVAQHKTLLNGAYSECVARSTLCLGIAHFNAPKDV